VGANRARSRQRAWCRPTRTARPDLATFDIDTLAIRMHEDALVHERVMFLPCVAGAWTRQRAG